jgi:outer membrane protein assembly factor BamD
MFKDAEADIQSDRYQIAVEKLQMVKNKFPYSRFSALAQLRLGDVYFLQDQFLEAATAYELFKDLHPKHERISYALFRVGESYLKDVPGNIQRDIASARNAESAFQQFLTRFPADPQVPEAKRQLQRARDIQAEKEYLIGEFYFHRKKWKAASTRFEQIVRDYRDTPSLKSAQERLDRSNAEIQKSK